MITVSEEAAEMLVFRMKAYEAAGAQWTALRRCYPEAAGLSPGRACGVKQSSSLTVAIPAVESSQERRQRTSCKQRNNIFWYIKVAKFYRKQQKQLKSS